MEGNSPLENNSHCFFCKKGDYIKRVTFQNVDQFVDSVCFPLMPRLEWCHIECYIEECIRVYLEKLK